MSNRVCSPAIVLICVFLFATKSVNAQNTTNSVDSTERLERTLEARAYLETERESSATHVTQTPARSLGTYSADGGSPGHIIARSWRDNQHHLNPGRAVGWSSGPQVYFTFTRQECVGDPDVCPPWFNYMVFDPTFSATQGRFIPDTNGLPLQATPSVEGGFFSQLAVTSDGKVLIAGDAIDVAGGTPFLRRVKAYWDTATPGTFGQVVDDTLPGDFTGGEPNFKYPRIEYQRYGDNYITHVVAINGPGAIPETRSAVYWRKVSGDYGPGGTWTSMLVDDSLASNCYSIAAAHDGSGKVAIAWVRYRDPSGINYWGSHLFVRQSSDAGATWGSIGNIVSSTYNPDDWQPWIECNALYDSDGYLHVVWNASKERLINPAVILHWTDRVSGPDAGGTTSLVHLADFSSWNMCGVGQYNDQNVGKPVISECNGRLYTIWKQFGDPAAGDSLDCCDPSLLNYQGRGNADIFMSVSYTLDGSTWGAHLNLTNSKSPGCDTTAGNECDHDHQATMSQ